MESIEQHEFYENARKRVRAKRKVYYHFVMFLAGSIILIIALVFLLFESCYKSIFLSEIDGERVGAKAN